MHFKATIIQKAILLYRKYAPTGLSRLVGNAAIYNYATDNLRVSTNFA